MHSLQHQPTDLQEPIPEWPYYPPEAYPGLSCSGSTSFRESTPEVVPVSSADVAPFQFSSSSLSAALSDPPRFHQPLPPETPPNELDADFITGSSSQPLSSHSLCHHPSFQGFVDLPMLLDSPPTPADTHISHVDSPSVPYAHREDATGTHAMCIDGPIAIQPSPNGSMLNTLLQDNSTNSPPASSLDQLYPYNPIAYSSPSGTLPPEHLYDDLSSASSSPFEQLVSLSPTTSPSSVSSVELPSTELNYPASLLFSAPYEPKSFKGNKRPRVVIARPVRPIGESRLSSIMPITAE